MSAERISLDSNVLVYAVDRDAGPRHGRAIELMERALYLDCVLTLQSLCEFFHAVARKGKASLEEAWAQVQDWQILFPVASAKPSTLARAVAAVQSCRSSGWHAPAVPLRSIGESLSRAVWNVNHLWRREKGQTRLGCRRQGHGVWYPQAQRRGEGLSLAHALIWIGSLAAIAARLTGGGA